MGAEPPIVQHTGRDLKVRSATRAGEIDTSTADVAKGPAGWEVWVTRGKPVSAWDGVEPVTVATRQGSLWTCYAFTPSSAVVVYGGEKGSIRSAWAMKGCTTPTLVAERRRVSVPGRKGEIAWLRGAGALREQAGVPVLEVAVEGGPSAFGFSDGSLRFGAWDGSKEELAFADGAGEHRLCLKGVVGADGNLDRGSSPRLRRN